MEGGRGVVAPAAPKACRDCPWRLSNQGTRHPGGWYTKANLARLWSKLRRGERMTCHPTDPKNPLPEGYPRRVPLAAKTRECSGALILAQREFMRYQALLSAGDADVPRRYRALSPRGLTRAGLVELVERATFGGTPLGGAKITRPDLNDPDVGYAPLGEWEPPDGKLNGVTRRGGGEDGR